MMLLTLAVLYCIACWYEWIRIIADVYYDKEESCVKWVTIISFPFAPIIVLVAWGFELIQYTIHLFRRDG